MTMAESSRKKYLYIEALGVWLLIGVLTAGLGVLRELLFIPLWGLSPSLARALELPLALAYILVLTRWLLGRYLGHYTQRDLLLLSGLWLLLTMLFETAMGWLSGRTVGEIAGDYNLAAGRTWVLFLLMLALAPWGVNGWLQRDSRRTR